MKVKNYREEISVPEGTIAHVSDTMISITKGKATQKREFRDPRLSLKVENNMILLEVPKMTKKEKMLAGTIAAHIKNMIKGVNQQYVYKLKICSGHFPMNITLAGKQFSVKNYVGEKVPRVLEIMDGVEIKIDGNDITVTSVDKESAGQTAGAIELLCRRPGFDTRIFQQGIYIIEKPGK